MKSSLKKGGEVKVLQDLLNSVKVDEKRDAIRKIIAAMTVGKDVSMLFPDVVKNLETPNMELKKLIYLYIINYAKYRPDQIVMAINTLRKDSMDKNNPLLRALAVRTMGCLRVKQITEYLCQPLKEALKDEDSYVRKTAAICVAKLYETHPELMEESGFVKILENLLNDGNAMVVSNAVAALGDISENKGYNMLDLTGSNVQKLLTALNESSEWGQIYILDALALYYPSDARDTENILERVSPRLSHSNPAVVLSCIRVIVKYLDFLTNPDVIRAYCRKLTPPLITLLSSDYEVQYVALKNINLIIQKRPNILEKETKIFFCNFNDPIYIKIEKLEILIKLANNNNIDQILHELKEYIAEVDVEFVRKAIRAIGKCAIKLDRASEKCVQALWECLRSKKNFVVQECIIVIRDIFRKYPRKYEAILKDLCDNLKAFDEPESKAAMMWIIGEYVDTIENADELLFNFVEGFKDELPIVQHQILTACVKLFLYRPQDASDMIQNLLRVATEECENPDLRDRAYIYWRLLFTDPELAKQITLKNKPVISDLHYSLDSGLLDKLIENIGTLSSIYQKPPEQFVKKLRDSINARIAEENEYYDNPEEAINLGEDGQQNVNPGLVERDYYDAVPKKASKEELDLLGIDEGPTATNTTTTTTTTATNANQSPQKTKQFNNIKIPYSEVLNVNAPGVEKKNTGLVIEGVFQREGPNIFLELKITNKSHDTVGDFAIKFNANSFRLQSISPDIDISTIDPNQSVSVRVPCDVNGQSDNQAPSCPFKIQVALKCSLDVFVFFIPCSFSIFLVSDTPLTVAQYQELQQRPNQEKTQNQINTTLDGEAIKKKLTDNNVYYVNSRKNDQGIEMISFSAKTTLDLQISLDVIYNPGANVIQIQYSTPHPALKPLFYQAIVFIITMN